MKLPVLFCLFVAVLIITNAYTRLIIQESAYKQDLFNYNAGMHYGLCAGISLTNPKLVPDDCPLEWKLDLHRELPQ